MDVCVFVCVWFFGSLVRGLVCVRCVCLVSLSVLFVLFCFALLCFVWLLVCLLACLFLRYALYCFVWFGCLCIVSVVCLFVGDACVFRSWPSEAW